MLDPMYFELGTDTSKRPGVHSQTSFSSPKLAPPTLFVVIPCPPNSHRFPEVSLHVTLPQRPPGPVPGVPPVVPARLVDSNAVRSPVLTHCGQTVGGLGGALTTTPADSVVMGALAGIHPPDPSLNSQRSFSRPGRSGGVLCDISRQKPPNNQCLPELSVQAAA